MDSEKKISAGHGIMIMMGATVIARMGSALLSPLLIKILGPDQFGTFLGIQAMVFTGCGLCDLGLSHGYRVVVSRNPTLRRQYLGSTILIHCITSLIYLGALTFYLIWSQTLSIAALLIATGALAAQWVTIIMIDLQIARHFWKSFLINLLPFITLSVSVVLIWLGDGKLIWLAIGYSVGMVFRALISLTLLEKSSIRLTGLNRNYFKLVRTSVPFGLGILIGKMEQFWSITFVMVTVSSFAAGILGLPLKIYQIILVITTTTSGVTLPIFHKMAQDPENNTIGPTLSRLLGPLWAIGGIATGLCLLSPETIVSLFGNKDYSESIGLIPFFGVALLFKSLSIPAGNLLEARDLQWLRITGQAIGLVAMVATIVYFLPRNGLKAVAITIMAMDIWLFTWNWTVNAMGLGKKLPWDIHIRALTALLLALGTCTFFPIAPIYNEILYVVLYLFLLTLLGGWQINDILKLLLMKKSHTPAVKTP